MNNTQEAINTGKADVSLRQDGHVLIRIHENQDIDLADIMKINAAKNELVNKKMNTVIFVTPELGSFSREAREYSASAAVYHNAIAKAVVTTSISMRLISNFFINFHKPSAPTRIFSCVNEAAKWLDKQREKSQIM